MVAMPGSMARFKRPTTLYAGLSVRLLKGKPHFHVGNENGSCTISHGEPQARPVLRNSHMKPLTPKYQIFA